MYTDILKLYNTHLGLLSESMIYSKYKRNNDNIVYNRNTEFVWYNYFFNVFDT